MSKLILGVQGNYENQLHIRISASLKPGQADPEEVRLESRIVPSIWANVVDMLVISIVRKPIGFQSSNVVTIPNIPWACVFAAYLLYRIHHEAHLTFL